MSSQHQDPWISPLNDSLKMDVGIQRSVGAAVRVAEEERLYIKYLSWLITGILHRMVTPLSLSNVHNGDSLRCTALIGDTLHMRVLFNTLSLTDGGSSWLLPTFSHRIEEKEDLQDPGPQTLTTLQAILKAGCRVLVILMGDGLKVGKLLHYGDKQRVLDTRANYILLYDPDLFRPEFLYLWRKIVNVLFLLAHGKDPPWFELKTVQFPSWNEEKGSRLMDVWSHGVFRLGDSLPISRRNLFLEKTTTLKRKTLGVATFDHMPSAVKRSVGKSHSAAFHGVEIEILKTLAKFMDFKAHVREVDEQWGRPQDGGNWSGLVGAVAMGEADIALGNLFYTPYFLDKFDLSIPYMIQCQTFLTPESQKENSWLTLVLPFQGAVWGAIISALITGGLLFWSLAALHSSYRLYQHPEGYLKGRTSAALTGDGHPFARLGDALFYSWGMLLQVPTPVMPTPWPLRILNASWWVFCLLTAVAYRSAMTAVLSSPPHRFSFDTLEDLAAASSHISCGGWGEQPREFFATALDEASHKLGLHFEALEGLDTSPIAVAEKVAQGHFAYYENEFWLRAARVGYLDREKQNRTCGSGLFGLHVMQQCAVSIPISVGLATNSPIKARVDSLLRRMVEGGLVAKWLRDVMHPTLEAERQLASKEGHEEALVDLRKMYGALFALAAGYLAASIALLMEVVQMWRVFPWGLRGGRVVQEGRSRVLQDIKK